MVSVSGLKVVIFIIYVIIITGSIIGTVINIASATAHIIGCCGWPLNITGRIDQHLDLVYGRLIAHLIHLLRLLVFS